MADYIERDVIIKDLKHATDDHACPLHIATEVYQVATECPAADVRPERHGAWLPLETTNGEFGKKVFECSECRTFHFSTEFCPKCGALSLLPQVRRAACRFPEPLKSHDS